MNNHISQSPFNGTKSIPKSKDTTERRKQPKQLTILLSHLEKGAYTTSQLSMATGIPKGNICRYVVDICEQLNYIGRFRDPLTGHIATFYTLPASNITSASDFAANLYEHE